jgi:hypothetical protein
MQYDPTKGMGYALAAYDENSASLDALKNLGVVFNMCEPWRQRLYVSYPGSDFCISPNCEYVASVNDKHVTIWNSDGSPHKIFRHITGSSHLTFIGNESVLECSENKIMLWDLNERKLWSRNAEDAAFLVTSVSKDQKYIALTGDDYCQLLTVAGKEIVKTPYKELVVHFTDNSRYMLLMETDKTRVYDIQTENERVIDSEYMRCDETTGYLYFADDDYTYIYDSELSLMAKYYHGKFKLATDYHVRKEQPDKVLAVNDATITLYSKDRPLWKVDNAKYFYGSRGLILSNGEILTYGAGKSVVFWTPQGTFNYFMDCLEDIKTIRELKNRDLLVLTKGCRVIVINHDSPRRIRYLNIADALEISKYTLTNDHTGLYTYNGIVSLIRWDISDQGRRLYLKDADGFVRFDQQSIRESVLVMSKDGVLSSFNLNGDFIKSIKIKDMVSGSQNRNGIILCRVKGKETGRLEIYDAQMNFMNDLDCQDNVVPVSSDDGSRLLRVVDGEVVISDMKGSIVGTFPAIDRIDAVNISPDNTIVGQWDANGTVCLHDVNTGKDTPLAGKFKTVDACAFSPDSKYLYVREGMDNMGMQSIEVFDMKGKSIAANTFYHWAQEKPVFAREGNKLIVCSGDQVNIWNFTDRDVTTRIVQYENLSKSDITTMTVSERTNIVCIALENGTILAYDERGRIIFQYNQRSPVFFLKLSPDDSCLFVQTNKEYGMFDIPSKVLIKRIHEFNTANTIQ